MHMRCTGSLVSNIGEESGDFSLVVNVGARCAKARECSGCVHEVIVCIEGLSCATIRSTVQNSIEEILGSKIPNISSADGNNIEGKNEP